MSPLALNKRLGLVWGVVLLALNYVALVRIGTGPAKLPDLQGLYDADAIRAFLAALDFDTRGIYLGTYLPLDFLFIVLTFWLLLRVAHHLKPRGHWIVILAAAIFVAADITENLTLRELVNDRNAATCFFGCEDIFTRLIWATRIKFAALGVAAVILAVCYVKRRTS